MKKPVIITLVFVAIGMLIYLFKDKVLSMFKPKAPAPEPTQSSTENNTTTTIIKYEQDPNIGLEIPIALNVNLTLKKGSKNAEVKQLQSMMNQALKLLKYKAIGVDGSFGSQTENALYLLTKTKQTTLSKFATAMVSKMKG